VVDQGLDSLNLLRASRINPRLSAYAQLNGAFDYNATPMAPPGTRVLLHEKPSIRGSWALHGEEGWYVGPTKKHYRCYTIHVNRTNSERIGDTVEFFPTHTTMPAQSSANAAMQAAKDLIHALQHPYLATPFDVGDKQLQALKQLATIFEQALQQPLIPDKPAAPRVEPLSPPEERRKDYNTDSNRERHQHHQYNTRSKTPAKAAATMQTEPTPALHPSTMPLANAVLHPTTGKDMSYRELITNQDAALCKA